MKSPRPVIFNDEIRDLPDRAGAALAYRAIARTLDILPHTGAEPWPREATELADRLMQQLYAIACGGDFPPNSFVLGYDGYKTSQAILEQFNGGSHNRVAWLCVQDGMTASGMGAQAAYGWSVSLVWNISPRSESKKAERVVKNANWNDFRQLRLAFEEGELTDETPVPPDNLGPLWPDGTHDWTRYNWQDAAAMNEAHSKQTKNRHDALEKLEPRSKELAVAVRDALDRTADSRGDGWCHAFTVA